MGIGKKIKQRREALQITQAELGKLVGVTPSAITNYESDVSHPKEHVLYKLFDALDCDANYLFEDALTIEAPPPLSAEELKLFNLYKKLNKAGKQKLIEQAELLAASGLYSNEPFTVAARNGNPPKSVPGNPDDYPDAPDTV